MFEPEDLEYFTRQLVDPVIRELQEEVDTCAARTAPHIDALRADRLPDNPSDDLLVQIMARKDQEWISSALVQATRGKLGDVLEQDRGRFDRIVKKSKKGFISYPGREIFFLTFDAAELGDGTGVMAVTPLLLTTDNKVSIARAFPNDDVGVHCNAMSKSPPFEQVMHDYRGWAHGAEIGAFFVEFHPKEKGRYHLDLTVVDCRTNLLVCEQSKELEMTGISGGPRQDASGPLLVP